MGIIKRALGLERAELEQADTRSVVTVYPHNLSPALGSAPGIQIAATPELALAQPTIFASVRMISSSVASMPWRSYMRETNEPAGEQPAIIRQPDPFHTREATMRQIAMAMLLRGEAFMWLTAPDRSGRPTVAIPISNDEVRIQWDEQRLRPEYRWRGRELRLNSEILHLKYLDNWPHGLRGLGPVQMLSRTISGALNADRLVAEQFTDGAWVDGVLTAPNRMTETEANRLRAQWDETHAGKRGTAVLENGITYTPVQMSNSDAELLGSRKWYATELVRAFGIPAPLAGLPMGEGSSLTYQNIEGVKSQYAQFAVQVVTDTIEAGFAQLIPSTQEPRFSFAALLRADTRTRYDVYTQALEAGILTINEVRALEGLPDIAGGDEPAQARQEEVSA